MPREKDDAWVVIVIPGPAKGRSPESIRRSVVYGFRARRFRGAPE
jgi:hypothetical protein